MDHQEAVAGKAVERYLLNELSSSEKEQFEDHYFDCTKCASALQKQEIFLANAKVILAEPLAQPESRWHRLKSWFRFPVLVPTMAALLIGYLGLFQSGLFQTAAPTMEMAFAVHPQVRGEVNRLTIKPGTSAVKMSMDLLPGEPGKKNPWEKFTWELRNAKQQVASGSGEAQNEASAFTLPAIPVGKLEPGAYKLVLRSSNGSPEESSEFVIEKSGGKYTE